MGQASEILNYIFVYLKAKVLLNQSTFKSESLVKVKLPLGDVKFIEIPKAKQLILVASTRFFSNQSHYEFLIAQNKPLPDIHLYWAIGFHLILIYRSLLKIGRKIKRLPIPFLVLTAIAGRAERV